MADYGMLVANIGSGEQKSTPEDTYAKQTLFSNFINAQSAGRNKGSGMKGKNNIPIRGMPSFKMSQSFTATLSLKFT